jgi:hypothetical protein
MKPIEDLQTEILEANWLDMQFHLKQGTLFSIEAGLSLKEVGFAISSDQALVVEGWIEKGLITRLEKPNQFGKNELFSMLIVQPFVLVQHQDSSER